MSLKNNSYYLIKFYSYSKIELNKSLAFFYFLFLKFFFKELQKKQINFKTNNQLPITKKRFTFLRSPHVNKKSQEHLGFYIYKHILTLSILNPNISYLYFFCYLSNYFNFKVLLKKKLYFLF